MQPDTWALYAHMLRSRLFEESVAVLWEQGLVSGEMHLGTGEEGVVAGVMDHVGEGDALALDHRGTPPLIMRGVDPVLLLREFLGRPDGLCGGMGGHMHLFSAQHLAASSGIVGASGPAAAGFGLAAARLRPGTVSVAFFGEGAMNQGMLLEAMNLAAAWKLPVLFVCKDNAWAITSRSAPLTGGSLPDRARGLGLPVTQADGRVVEEVWYAARDAFDRARQGEGPSFLLARCVHLAGHFLGDPVLKVARRPVAEGTKLAGPLLRSLFQRTGAPVAERLSSLGGIGRLSRAYAGKISAGDDPLVRARQKLEADPGRLRALEATIEGEIGQALEKALGAG